MNPRLRALAGLAGVILLIVGCNKQTDTVSTAPPPGGPGGPKGPPPSANASAKELFDYHCVNCHRPGGYANAPRGKLGGPDLAKTARDPDHTADWIVEHIKNPKTHAPGSRMPNFEGQLTPEQMRKLADYVLSLKS
jgi:mono/diheme cytochrome c family protein